MEKVIFFKKFSSQCDVSCFRMSIEQHLRCVIKKKKKKKKKKWVSSILHTR